MKRVPCFLAALLLLSGFDASAQAAKVRLAIGYIPDAQFAPLYAGMERGFFRAEGIDLEIEYGFSIDVFSLLAAGRIDLGLSDSDQLIMAGAKGMGLKAVFQYYQKYPVAIVARADRIREPADLKGKLIGTPELYGTSYIGMQLFLRKFGLAGSARFEKIGYAQIPALETGKVDAVVCFLNNEPIQLRRGGMDLKEWDVKDFSDMVGASFIASARGIAERGDVLARFARAMRRSMAFTVENREEAFAATLKNVMSSADNREFLRMKLDATCALFPHPDGYGTLDVGRYERSIGELASMGLIARPFPAETILQVLPGR